MCLGYLLLEFSQILEKVKGRSNEETNSLKAFIRYINVTADFGIALLIIFVQRSSGFCFNFYFHSMAKSLDYIIMVQTIDTTIISLIDYTTVTIKDFPCIQLFFCF